VVEEALLRIDHIAQERDWLPWRLPKMTLPTRVAAVVAVAALILAGALALAGIGSSRGPLPTPLTTPSAATSPGLSLTQVFVSPTYGYSVRYPAGWTLKPATTLWPNGVGNPWNSGLNDELSSAGAVRFSGASQPLADGQTPDAWLAAYATPNDPASLPTLTVDGATGVITADDVAAAGGTISPGGRMFDLVVVSGGRAYNFNMDGRVDRATFESVIGSIALDPAGITAIPERDTTVPSPWYGYTIALPNEWGISAATEHWHGFDNSPPVVYEITIPGTDTTLTIASQPLAGQSFDDWLSAYHENTSANVPTGCDGGDPATWKAIPVGEVTGRWYELCNAAEAVAESGGRVYVFSLAHETFDVSRHLAIPFWLSLLEGVALDPSAAVDGG
jgi:hypothetical protein